VIHERSGSAVMSAHAAAIAFLVAPSYQSKESTPMTSRPAGFDTDQDGMPDTWETAHGLQPATADNNGDFDSDGYTNLEEYLNEIAAWPAGATALFNGSTNQRYAQITNWNLGAAPTNTGARATALWQPTRFDLAQIRAGEAIVDAVGQHAGTLQIAASSGRSTLTVTDGWLEIQDNLDVGALSVFAASGATRLKAGAGQVRQSGGSVLARAVVLGGPAGALGEYHLAGGRLSTPLLTKRGVGAAGFDFTGGRLQARPRRGWMVGTLRSETVPTQFSSQTGGYSQSAEFLIPL